MASFKSNSVFYSILVVLGLAAVAGGWGIYNRSAAATKSAGIVAQKRAELTKLLSTNPAPTEESKISVEADLHRTEAALITMREELKGRGPAAEALRSATVPAEPTDLFFNLATFVEKTREKAKEANVQVKPDERFGFASYATAGPDRQFIPQVFRQRQIAEYLLNALLEARPTQFISLQRERPQSQAELAAIAAGQPLSSASGATSQSNPDLFEIDSRITARVPGFVGASAFRLTFNGETNSLRSLLNKLAQFELPLVVRSVEVEPIAQDSINAPPAASAPPTTLNEIFGTPSGSTPGTPEAPKPKPLVERTLSKFTVTVELIDLVAAPSPEATPTT